MMEMRTQYWRRS